MFFNVVEFQCYLNLSSLNSEYWVNEYKISVNKDNIYVTFICFGFKVITYLYIKCMITFSNRTYIKTVQSQNHLYKVKS